MTVEELTAVLEEEHKNDDPGHRKMWIGFVLGEVASGRMVPQMIDGVLHLEFVYAASTETVAEA